jgi:hypothetical protein
MEANNKVQLTNTMALVGFVMSFFNGLVGLILSIIGMSQIKKTGEPGKGYALAGIIMSAISMFLSLIFYVIYFIYFIVLLEDIM